MADRFRTELNAQFLRAFDPFHHALTTINEEHRLIHDGMVFYMQKAELDVPDGAFRNLLLRTNGEVPHFKRILISASEGPVNVEIYENAVVDVLGTEIIPLNTNRLSTNTPTVRVYDNTTTYTAPGDPLLGGLYIPAIGNNGVTGGTTAIEELVLKPNTDYQLSLQNDPAGSGSADIVFTMVWYELTYDTP